MKIAFPNFERYPIRRSNSVNNKTKCTNNITEYILILRGVAIK